MCLGLSVLYASATNECVETHRFTSKNVYGLTFQKMRVDPRKSVAKKFARSATHYRPFGYTRILLASPVFSRSIAFEKSFIGMRSVITGCRFSLPLLSSAVI